MSKYNPECCQCACYLKEFKVQLPYDEEIKIWKCPNQDCLNNHPMIAFVDDRLVECSQCPAMDSRV